MGGIPAASAAAASAAHSHPACLPACHPAWACPSEAHLVRVGVRTRMRARVRARVTVRATRARASLGGCRRTSAHLHWHPARCDRLLRCRVGRDKPGRELCAQPGMLRPWLGLGSGPGSGSVLGLGLELGLGLGRASAPSLSTYTALPVQSSPSSYCSFTWSCQRHSAIRSVCRARAWALPCPVGLACPRKTY